MTTMTAIDRRAAPSPAELRELRLEIEEFNYAYAQALDDQDLHAWTEFFADDGFYRITARENWEANLPLGLIYCDGNGMLTDRANAVLETVTYAPRYHQHFNSNVRVTGVDPDGTVHATSNYLVLRTQIEEETRIFESGRYFDRFEREGGVLRLKSRDCVYDTLTILNALIFPV
jgi:anthranilate 1,2-dioxygenase small subunit